MQIGHVIDRETGREGRDGERGGERGRGKRERAG